MATRNWMPHVRQHRTNAFGGYSNFKADTVVCHIIERWRTTMDRWAKEAPVQNQVSYHFVIDIDGTITQYIPVIQASWAQGRVDSVQYPHVGINWMGYRPGVNPNSHVISIGAEGFSATGWNKAQHTACGQILNWLQNTHGININASTLIGHNDICPMTRAEDPGPNWDKDLLLNKTNRFKLPDEIKKTDWKSWKQAWQNGATPVGYDGLYEIHQIKIKRRLYASNNE